MNFLFPYMARWKAVNWTRYHQIFTCLAKMGHKIFVLQPPPANIHETNFQEIECELPANIQLIDIDVNQFVWSRNWPLSKIFKKGYYSLRCRNVVNKLINEHKIDVLLLYNIPQYFLLRDATCFTIFDFADDYIDMLRYELGRFSNPIMLGLAEHVLFSMIKKANLTTVVSQALIEYLKTKQKKMSFSLAPNGIDPDEFILSADEPKDASDKNKKPVVGFIGAFEYFIDFDLILNAAEKLPDIEFLLVGAGRDLPKVKSEAQDKRLKNITLIGGVPHSEIKNYIQKMDICLNIFKKMPVSEHACPIKLFEYLIMKKPIISTRLEEIRNIDKGFIFFADTTDEIVGEIKKIINNKEMANACIKEGYKLVATDYNWQTISTNLLEVINKAMGR